VWQTEHFISVDTLAWHGHGAIAAAIRQEMQASRAFTESRILSHISMVSILSKSRLCSLREGRLHCMTHSAVFIKVPYILRKTPRTLSISSPDRFGKLRL